MNDDVTDESGITTDRETIRTWIEESGGTPAFRTTAEGETESRMPYIHYAEQGTAEGVEETSWDEFFATFDENEMAVIRYPEGKREGGRHEVIGRTEAVERATLADAEVEEALLEGKTVQSEITETTVVEREIVETIDVESEVVDREVVRDDVVDTEVVMREIVDTELLDDETIEVTLDETRSVTRDIVERLLVESRVVDVDVEERDTVESETLEGRVDLEGVQRQILESDLVRGDAEPELVVEEGRIVSEFTGDQTIQSDLFERRVVEEQVVDRKRLVYELVETELLESETVESTVVEHELVSGDVAEGETTASAETTTSTEMGTETKTEAEAETGTTASTEAEAATAESAGAVTFDEGDMGKDVISSSGEMIGIVADVESDQIYVDPHPSLTDRIKAKLDWGDRDEETYPVEADRIAEVTADEVKLRSF